MEVPKALLLVAVFVVLQLQSQSVVPSPTTFPAFLWSPHQIGLSRDDLIGVIDYRTLSPNDLAKSVLKDGGWSNFVCLGEGVIENVDIALVFVGSKLQASDISKTKHLDPALFDLLKVSFANSNFSIAFPYVALSNEKTPLENSLVSGFIDNCGHGFDASRTAYLESCSVNREGLKKLNGLRSVLDLVSSRMESGTSKQTDLIFFCSSGPEELVHDQSEGEILSGLVNFLEQSGAKYTVLYISDPYRSLQYAPHLAMSRFLAENKSGNASADSKSIGCDGVCQLKSSLLEGLFVAIVLLIILISGLCCMMGIDSPRKFEAPQEL